MTRKAAYVDFSQERYKTISDEEITVLKKINTNGQRESLFNCAKHGLHYEGNVTLYDEHSNKTKHQGCPECIMSKDYNNINGKFRYR